MQFSARRDPELKRGAPPRHCSITIILSRRRDPAVIAVAQLGKMINGP
jgi:hypothetical protein